MKMSDNIAIFYHVFQNGENWTKMFEQQIVRLQASGLYDIAKYIHIGVNGSYRMPFNLTKVDVVKRNKNYFSEADTLKDLYQFCRENPEYKVLYFHTKGISFHDVRNLPARNASDIDYFDNVELWREYLEYFNIDKWKRCVKELNSHDTAGTEWHPYANLNCKDISIPSYSGNFWWANASYINTLDPNFLDNKEFGRFACEFWIGTGNPKAFNFYTDSLHSKYENPVDPQKYKKYGIGKKSCRIGMISMFKNEAHSIKNMLDSVSNYIDYWVLQDNGSTDGTPDVVSAWAEKTKIPGFMYKVDEGWVNFGWNRDHVLQKFLQSEHNCDWIMKMDCDETLKVDDEFDWDIFDNDIVSYNVQSEDTNAIYYKTWIWNSKYPWRFNHDPAHETIYIDDGTKNTDFQRVCLPSTFKMLSGETFGESYTVPTKYVSDSLKLEEKIIREGNIKENSYHFWYLAKSYADCFALEAFPLGKKHQQEFARRCIFYNMEFLNLEHNYENTNKAARIDEMAYMSICAVGNGYRFLGEYEKAEYYYNQAEQFAPKRNDHLIHLAELFWKTQQFDRMLICTNTIMQLHRKCPFPEYCFLINKQFYYDTGNYCHALHQIALDNSGRN